MKTRSRSVFRCQSCGAAHPQWRGQCSSCEAWNTLVEETLPAPSAKAPKRLTSFSSAVTALGDVSSESGRRLSSGLAEFDRVLGGGLLEGSLVLLGGPPGIGKSTLMLQVAHAFAREDHGVLYVSGEESLSQVGHRAKRLGLENRHLWLLSETNVENILEALRLHKPQTVVIDSIQTLYKAELSGAPGSVGQIRECAAEFLQVAKGLNVSVFLLGHVTKEGDLAGPRVLEHMVDTVLYFETEKHHCHRLLRAVKNRFGPANEIALFEMTAQGLAEAGNPSHLFLSEAGGLDNSGVAVSCVMEGTRPLLVEIQALAAKTPFGLPRRQASGFDYNRLLLLVAVMEKRLGLRLDNHDVFVNVTGGIQLKEPSCDLALSAALASTLLDKPLPRSTLWIGEVGLGGEIRPVHQLAERVSEAARLGYGRLIYPRVGSRGLVLPKGLEGRPMAHIGEAFADMSSKKTV